MTSLEARPTAELYERVPSPELANSALLRLLPKFLAEDLRPTRAQVEGFAKYGVTGDPLADAVVAAMKGPGGKELRGQFEQALAHGIDTVSDAPPVLREFFAAVEEVPYWVDPEKLQRGAEVTSRMGPLLAPSLLVGLALTYTTPDGNAVLLRAGDTRDKAGTRAVETLSWLSAVTTPGALRRGELGFQSSVRVRLTHAFLRSGMPKRADWDEGRFAVHQQVFSSVIIAFTLVPLVVAGMAGNRLRRKDREAVVHLWRYIAYIVGVHPNLIPATESDTSRLLWMFLDEVIAPDAGSTELGTALIAAYPEIYGVTGNKPSHRIARWLLPQSHSVVARAALGNEVSDVLGFPKINPAIVPLVGLTMAVTTVWSALDVIPPVRRARTRVMYRSRVKIIDRMCRRTHADLSYRRE
ncbi:MAG: DUF2236 domain-containing protein [Mycolicibacterium sp.]|uniref:oxygenase MpaB family protein n=1 Tax=Mycolicibacterium sp. TaxID=2320850 RepID=UPI000F9C1ED6|nr:oxygenase MpaB family protein [Mycolicibacterium sp.]RUP31244.1 MAG: DUF2236 domain-containing protein [Mycolicibacterium sp.]